MSLASKFGMWVIGIVSLAFSIYGIVTGKVGAAAKSGAAGMVYRDQNPEYFWFSISLGLALSFFAFRKLYNDWRVTKNKSK